MNILENDTRRAIVTLLRARELSAGDIASALSKRRPAISHHLSTLLTAGAIHCRTEGAFRFYRIDAARVLRAWDDLLAAYNLRTRELAA